MFVPVKYVATAVLIVCSIVCSAQSTPPPSWLYATYFGGSQTDSINAANRDAAGNIYISGITSLPRSRL